MSEAEYLIGRIVEIEKGVIRGGSEISIFLHRM